MTERSWGKDAISPFLEIGQSDVISWRYDSAFVDSANEFDYDFISSVVVDDLELSNVSGSLHDFEESDDEGWDGSDENLLFAFSLGIDYGSETVGENVYFDHGI